jgi:hypothetical protein
VVSLFGPTNPDRTCPYGQRNNVLTLQADCEVACRERHCRFSTPHCLVNVPVELVAERVARVARQ